MKDKATPLANDELDKILKDFLDSVDFALEIADKADPKDKEFFDRPYIQAKQSIQKLINDAVIAELENWPRYKVGGWRVSHDVDKYIESRIKELKGSNNG